MGEIRRFRSPSKKGERTPESPMPRLAARRSLTNLTRTKLARAVIEGTVASQVAMLELMAACGLRVERLMLIGGAAGSVAVQTILAQMVDVPL